MEKSIDIIQKCQIDDHKFNQTWFLELVKNLSPDDFNKFCKEIAHLHHFYSTSVGVFCTDNLGIAKENPDVFWQMEEIDFNAPVNFKRVK